MKLTESIIAIFIFEFCLKKLLPRTRKWHSRQVPVTSFKERCKTAVVPRIAFLSRVSLYSHSTQCSKLLQTCTVFSCRMGRSDRRCHANPDLTLKGEIQFSAEGPRSGCGCRKPYVETVCRKWPLRGLCGSPAWEVDGIHRDRFLTHLWSSDKMSRLTHLWVHFVDYCR